MDSGLPQAAARLAALYYSSGYAAMGRHDEHRDAAVSVAELLIRAAEQGRALRLNWLVDDKDPCGFAATTDDDWPTGVLPRIEDDMPDPRTSSAVAESHRHEPSAIPEPFRQVHVESDTEFLGRILDGLRRLP